METSYSVQTRGRGGGFHSGDQAEPGAPPPLWPRGGRWALSGVNSAAPAATWAPRARRAPPPAGSQPGGGQPQVGCRKSPRLPIQAVLSTSPSLPSQGQTKTYQTFGLEGAVPPPPLPLLTGGRRPLQQLLSQALAFHLGNADEGISPRVAAPFCSQDCSCAQELLSPAGTPLSFPESPGILRSLRSSV